MNNTQFNKQELKDIAEGLRLLRDRHYRNYDKSIRKTSTRALRQYKRYLELGELRTKFRGY